MDLALRIRKTSQVLKTCEVWSCLKPRAESLPPDWAPPRVLGEYPSYQRVNRPQLLIFVNFYLQDRILPSSLPAWSVQESNAQRPYVDCASSWTVSEAPW